MHNTKKIFHAVAALAVAPVAQHGAQNNLERTWGCTRWSGSSQTVHALRLQSAENLTATHPAEVEVEVEERAKLVSLIADAIKESKKQEEPPKSWVWKWAKRAGAALLGAGAVAGTVVGLVPFIGDQINAQIDGIAENIREEISGTTTHFETEITASREHTSAEIETLAATADNQINATGGQATAQLDKISNNPVVQFLTDN